jgi:hypothetical protein
MMKRLLSMGRKIKAIGLPMRKIQTKNAKPAATDDPSAKA